MRLYGKNSEIYSAEDILVDLEDDVAEISRTIHDNKSSLKRIRTRQSKDTWEDESFLHQDPNLSSVGQLR